MKNLKLSLVILLSIVGLSTISFAQSNRSENFNLQHGIAIKGFDPVTYFATGQPVRANGSIAYTYNGIKYFFASTKNLAQFKTTPGKYEPQYGGWCAYHMGLNGEKVAADPEIYVVHKGKLYFFDSEASKLQWEADEHTPKGDENWIANLR